MTSVGLDLSQHAAAAGPVVAACARGEAPSLLRPAGGHPAGPLRDQVGWALAPVRGRVTALVAAVPADWLPPDRLVMDGAAAHLCDLLREQLGLPLHRLLHAPVAAAVGVLAPCPSPPAGQAGPAPSELWGHRLLVCHAGAETVSGALCGLDGPAVRLLRSEQAPVPGFDAAAARLLTTRVLGSEPAPDHPLLQRLRESVAAARQTDRRRAETVLQRAATQQHYRDALAYRIHGYALTAGQVGDCLTPTVGQIATVVRSLLTSTGKPTAVAVVGDLARLHPVRAAVMDALEGNTDGDALRIVDSDFAEWAVARGAALVASSGFDPGDRYPHTVAMPVRQIVGGRLVSKTITLADAGLLATGDRQVHFAQKDGHPLTVNVEPDDARPVGLEVKLHGVGRPLPLRVPRPFRPLPGSYHVGLRVDADGGVTLALRPAAGGAVLFSPAGRLPPHPSNGQGEDDDGRAGG